MEDRQKVDIQEYIRDIIDRLYFKSQAEADRYLKLHYETVFGIYDHNSVKARTNKPSSPIYHHPGLSAGDDAVTHELLIKYRENRIHDVSKMTFLEYIMLPRSRFREFGLKCRQLAEADDQLKEAEAARQEANMRAQLQNVTGKKKGIGNE